MPGKILGIHFRHDQGAAIVHTPGSGIVHDHTASLGGVGSKLEGSGTTSGKDGDIHSFKAVFLQFAYGQFLVAKFNLAPRASRRGKGQYFGSRKGTLMQRVQHFSAHGTGGTTDRNSQLAHLKNRRKGPDEIQGRKRRLHVFPENVNAICATQGQIVLKAPICSSSPLFLVFHPQKRKLKACGFVWT